MDLRKLKTILELFENSDVAELEISEGDDRVRLSRSVASAPVVPVPAVPAHPSAASVPVPGTSASESGTGTGGNGSDFKNEIAAEDGEVVTSPMVGIFYRAPSPDRPPFVSEGKRVEKGDTLCVIEAMKLMNELPSPAAGVVRRVVPGNGEPVGFGDPLFVIGE